MLTLLCIGDIVGKGGRRAVTQILPKLKEKYPIDGVIANVENIAHGKGVTKSTLQEMLDVGVDVATSGNHIWSKPEAFTLLPDASVPLLRPANFPAGTVGTGARTFTIATKPVLVINLMGRVFMKDDIECPFRTLDTLLETQPLEKFGAIIVDFHAETTSEKNAFAQYADGRVSAVVGTHTHIPTADNRVLPKGTAFTTDIGMVGVRDSILGVEKEGIIERFLTQMPTKHEIAETGIVVFNAVLLKIGDDGRATEITRIQEEIEIL